jgi:hypothetical protein
MSVCMRKWVQCFYTGFYYTYTITEIVPSSTTRWHQVYMYGKGDLNYWNIQFEI